MSQIIQEIEAQMDRATDPQAKIELLNELAWELRMDDPAKARALSEHARELATSGQFATDSYLPGLAGSLRNLAFLNNDVGHFNLAITQSLQALEILEDTGDSCSKTSLIAIDVLGNLSWTYYGYGDYGIAAEHGMKAFQKLAQEMGDRVRQARLLNILSNIYAESKDLDAALDMGQSALQCYRDLGLADGESVALNNLALTYLQDGNGDRALETCHESLRIALENKITAVVLTSLSTLGEIYLGINQYIQAEEYLLQALDLARERGSSYDEFLDLLNLGKVYLSQQNGQSALTAFKDALEISQALKNRSGEFQCHQQLAEIYEKQGKFEMALHHFKQFHALKETVFNENTANRLAGLQVIHKVETAKRDAEIHYLKTIELKKEIEERKSTQAALEELAATDPLTGLLNRRQFFVLGERKVQISLQSKQPLSAILFDLDHFKQINDTYGHAIGDQVLMRAATIAFESLRQDEIVGRYGGDEFVILLPGCGSDQALQIAERLRGKISTQVINTPQGKLSLTISLGIAELSATKSTDVEMLLNLADQALYTAKRGGRDQLAVFQL